MAGWSLPYGWNRHLCFLFRAILSAINPVGKTTIYYYYVILPNIAVMCMLFLAVVALLVLFNLMYLLIEHDPEEQVSVGYVA
ncbi:hypothetical protein EON64_06025 [archaeon]|nr:MAG: hypothetical protein EON64_06025 [archaeon]